jgi:hypothetical protein
MLRNPYAPELGRLTLFGARAAVPCNRTGETSWISSCADLPCRGEGARNDDAPHGQVSGGVADAPSAHPERGERPSEIPAVQRTTFELALNLGRLPYGNQPWIALWNLARLAGALLYCSTIMKSGRLPMPEEALAVRPCSLSL